MDQVREKLLRAADLIVEAAKMLDGAKGCAPKPPGRNALMVAETLAAARSLGPTFTIAQLHSALPEAGRLDIKSLPSRLVGMVARGELVRVSHFLWALPAVKA